MNAGEVCTRSVITVEPDETIHRAARRMMRESVGTLVVVDPHQDEPTAIGILTDRDIVVRAVATDLDPETNPISSVMSVPVQAVAEDTSLEDALEIMSNRGIRRIVITGPGGSLAGILALDDVIDFLVEEIDAIGKLLLRSQSRPR